MTERVGFTFDIDSEEGQRAIMKLESAITRLTQALGALSAEGDETEDALGKTKESAEKASAGVGKVSKKGGGAAAVFTKLTPVLIAGAAAFAGVAIVGAKVAGVLADSVAAYEESAAVQTQLSNAFAQIGIQGREASEAMAEYDEALATASKATGANENELKGVLATLTTYTNEVRTAEQAETDLSIVQGAALAQKKGYGEVSRQVAQALQGEFGAAKELLGLNREQEEALTRINDPAERQAKIYTLLEEKYAGLAENIDPLTKAQLNVGNSFTGLRETMGEVLVSSGALAPFLEGISSLLDALSGELLTTKEGAGDLVKDGILLVVDGFSMFLDVVQVVSPAITAVITYLRLAKNWFGLVFDAVGLLGQGLLTLANTYLAGVSKGLANFLEGAQFLASFVSDDFERAISKAKVSVDDFADSRLDAAKGDWEKLKGDTLEAGENVEAMTKALTDIPGTYDAINEKTEQLKKGTAAVRKNIENASRVQQSDEKRDGIDTSSLDGESDDGGEAERQAALALREETAIRLLEIEKEKNATQRSSLELNFRLWEISLEQLTPSERKLEETKAILGYERQLLEIEARKQAELERQAREKEKQRKADLKALAEYQKRQEASLKQGIALGSAMGDVLAAGFEQAGVAARGISVIRAAQYAAEAIGSAIFGNPVAAINAGIAAGQHLAVAAGGGGGGGGGGVGGGGGGSAPRPSYGAQDRDAATRKAAEIYAEELRKSQDQAVTYNTTIEVTGTHLESAPALRQELSRFVMDDLRQGEGIDLERLRSANL